VKGTGDLPSEGQFHVFDAFMRVLAIPSFTSASSFSGSPTPLNLCPGGAEQGFTGASVLVETTAST